MIFIVFVALFVGGAALESHYPLAGAACAGAAFGWIGRAVYEHLRRRDA